MVKKTGCLINESSNYKLGRLDNKFWTFTQRVYHFWIYMLKKTHWWHRSLEPSPVWLVNPFCHGCFPLGPPSLGNHCKQWEWGITSRAEGQRCTSTHTLGVTGTSASLSREPFSIWPWHPGSTGGYLYDISIFLAILVDFSSVQQFRYLCKAHL